MHDDGKIYPPTPYERHLFVCVTGKTCPGRGSEQVLALLRQKAKAAGITDRIRVNKSGCLNQCAAGPVMVVYPEGIWYSGVSANDVDEIFTKTVLRGEVIERLLHRNRREA